MMKKRIIFFLCVCCFLGYGQSNDKAAIDLWNWKLELPSGYKASDWKLSNFKNDRFAAPFFYFDDLKGALVMKAYPAKGTSTAKYTRNTLREQMQPGSNDVNWTMKQGGILEVELDVEEISTSESGQFHRTILLQVDGRTTEKQTKQLGLSKPASLPMLKIYWQDGYIKVVRKILKDDGTAGDALLDKKSWKEDKGLHSKRRIGNDKVKIRLELKRGKILVQIDDERPIVYRDLSVAQWYFENYFTVGNYLQSKEDNCFSTVNYYKIEVVH